MGTMKGVMTGLGNSAKKVGSRIESNMVSASLNPTFFGAHSLRTGMVAEKNALRDSRRAGRVAKSSHADDMASIEGNLDSGFIDAAEGTARKNEANKVLGERRQQMAQDRTEAVTGMAGKIGTFATGGDFAGQGWKRAGAVGARWGTPIAASVAAGTGMRYATGGSFTQDREGNRDIAGLPFM